MNQVKLIGKSKKGKERVKQHGEIWNVKEVQRENLEDRLLLMAPDGDWRWVFSKSDLHFEVVNLCS
jgi:hypothetical protein